MARVLILGGTGEARRLADRLAGHDGLEVITSLAGRTRAPALPAGTLRVGGLASSPAYICGNTSEPGGARMPMNPHITGWPP